MRLPKHIILDFFQQNIKNDWIYNLQNNLSINLFFFKKKKTNSLINNSLVNDNMLINLININFLRKERVYTKLKYSRSPAYDIVSGGIAALFAGLLGFLISEKFGIELVDSGDFYYLLMYLIFFVFFLKPLIASLNNNLKIYHILTLRELFIFLKNVLNIFKKLY